MKYFISVDVSQDTFHYCIMDYQCAEFTHSNQSTMNKYGFAEIKETLNSYKDSVMSMASTGSDYINPLSFILLFKQEICLINPLLIKRFAQIMTLRKIKTGKVNATVMPQFVCQNIEHLPYFQLIDYDEISTLARTREDLSKQIATTKPQFKQQVNIVLAKLLSECNIFTDTLLKILLKLPTIQIIRNIDANRIVKTIDSIAIKGKQSRLSADKRKILAEQSIGKNAAHMEQIAQHYVKILLFLMEKMDKLIRTFIDAVNKPNKDDMKIISTFKDISDITIYHFFSEIKKINRFESKSTLITYSGTDPSVQQSSTGLHRDGKISRKGYSSLRRYLYLMATNVMKSNEYFRAYYLKKREQGMQQHRKAMITLYNKLLMGIFTLLKNGEKFVMPSHYL